MSFSSFWALADIRPGQDINTVDVFMGGDGIWHINSTYYRFIKVTYSVTHVSLYEENGPSVHKILTVILQKNENFSTGVATKDTYYSVGIVKVEFPPSDQEPSEQDRASGNEGDKNDANLPPNLNTTMTLKRTQVSYQRALGIVFINGKFVCYFMETPSNQGMMSKGTSSSIIRLQEGSVTIATGNLTEQLQFATSLTRDSNGGLTGIDESSSGKALNELLLALNFPQGQQEAALNVEIADFPNSTSFEQ